MQHGIRLGLARIGRGARDPRPAPVAPPQASPRRAGLGHGRRLRERLVRALTAGLDNLAIPSPYAAAPGVPATIATLGREATYRAGTAPDRPGEPAHALLVLRREPASVTVRGVAACGRRGDRLRIGADWRELPAQRQCPACHVAVVGCSRPDY